MTGQFGKLCFRIFSGQYGPAGLRQLGNRGSAPLKDLAKSISSACRLKCQFHLRGLTRTWLGTDGTQEILATRAMCHKQASVDRLNQRAFARLVGSP